MVFSLIDVCLSVFVQECSNLFSAGGAGKLADEFGINFLGNIPLDQVR